MVIVDELNLANGRQSPNPQKGRWQSRAPLLLVSRSVLLLRLDEVEQSLRFLFRINICFIGKRFKFDAVVADNMPGPPMFSS